MTILLLILKIIGIILLSLLGIVLLILFYLLVLPITYRVFASYAAGSPEVLVSFYDPLRLFKFVYTRDKEHGDTSIRLLWGLIKSGGNEDEDDTSVELPERDPDEESSYDDLFDEEDDDSEDIEPDPVDEGRSSDVVSDSADDEGYDNSDSGIAGSKITDSEREESDSADSDFADSDFADSDYEDSDFTDNLTETEEDEYNAEEKEDYSDDEDSDSKDYIGMISDEANQRAVKYVLNKVIILIRRIKPHIKSADIDFSLGSPDITGRLTGVCAMLPMAHSKDVHINPDFVSEEIYAVGHIHLIGRVQLIFPVIYAVAIIANADCRRLYKQIKD